MVVSVNNSNPELTISKVKKKTVLIVEELRRKEEGTNFESHTLVTHKNDIRGRSKSRGPCSRNNRSKSINDSLKNIKCHHRGKKGHIKKYYRILKR